MTYRKKLIEVALPLEEINVASAREKSIRHGHPSTLHLWWARRPLATCRAVLFASIIDDPGEDGAPQELLDKIDALPLAQKYRHLASEEPVDNDGKPLAATAAEKEKATRRRRYQLFTFIERLVQWENSNDPGTLETAHQLIQAATGGHPPPFLDPFCGGGSIPLEAQRLGLDAHASDLNPVAVLITKALIEIPPKFANTPPVNPDARAKLLTAWKGAQGLADDVSFYGRVIRDEAERRIGHLYPQVLVTQHMIRNRADLSDFEGRKLDVIAWLWSRSARCPNPACGAEIPLVHSYALSAKKGKEAWVEPVRLPDGGKGVEFTVLIGEPTETQRAAIEAGTCVVNDKDAKGRRLKKAKKVKATFLCPTCQQGVLKGEAIDNQANREGLGAVPIAIVAVGDRGHLYLPFTADQVSSANRAAATLALIDDDLLPKEPCRGTFASNAQGRRYGFNQFRDYFTPRQQVAAATLVSLVRTVPKLVAEEAHRCGMSNPQQYGEAVATYLAFAVDKLTDRNSSLVSWASSREHPRNTFARQSISIAWGYCELNCFSDSSGNFLGGVESLCSAIREFVPGPSGTVTQADARALHNTRLLHSTDPPYFDNVGFADLSDYFYVWLRRSLINVYPDLLSTMLTPKSEELFASPYRYGGDKGEATSAFELGLQECFRSIKRNSLPGFPTTIYYAFKQTETDSDDETGELSTVSTGWESMLQGLLDAGFTVNGTWPMRTEIARRFVSQDANALASCIVLVCRPRPESAESVNRRQFLGLLVSELRPALAKLTLGNIAPVDLAQAAIGPGMSVFSRYSAVLESDGKPMKVRTALGLINQALEEALSEQEGWYDPQTRWAVTWFKQRGFEDGPYGEAETLATAKDAPVGTLVEAGIIQSGGGKVKLLDRGELAADYDPDKDRRTTIWEATQYIVRSLDQHGELGAAKMMRRFRESKPDLDVDRARELAYRLYSICDQKKWTHEARFYNALVLSWSDIESVSQTDAADWQIVSASPSLFSE